MVLDAIQGTDPGDPSGIEAPWSGPSSPPVARLRIGILQSDLEEDGANRSNHLAALAVLRSLGATLRPVQLPDLPSAPLHLILQAEASAAFDEFTRNHPDDQLVQQEPRELAQPVPVRAPDSRRGIPSGQPTPAAACRSHGRAVPGNRRPRRAGMEGQVPPVQQHDRAPLRRRPARRQIRRRSGRDLLPRGLFREDDPLAVAIAFQGATSWHRQRPDLSDCPSHDTRAPRTGSQ